MSDPVRQIADAVLYEGYLLWPYRRSATKNRQRWTFGGVYPEAWTAAGAPDDPSEMRTELLLEGDDRTRVEVEVRFLHVVERRVARLRDGALEPVEELTVGGERHLSWDEATERSVTHGVDLGGLLTAPARLAIDVPAGLEEEPLREADAAVGVLLRRWRALRGTVEIAARRLPEGLLRLTVQIRNTSAWDGGDREEALKRTFVSTHTVTRASGGAFVSLTDPPEPFREAAAACRNVGAWPVLVGEEGDRQTMLSSPIILEDHPRIAPESPGDLFDGTEIDQLLTLSILSLTDEEQREIHDSDPRARRILERTAALTPEQLMQLHGTVRELHAELRELSGP